MLNISSQVLDNLSHDEALSLLKKVACHVMACSEKPLLGGFKIPLKLVSEVFQFLISFNFKFPVMLISRQAGSEVRLTLKHYKAATPFLLRQFGK